MPELCHPTQWWQNVPAPKFNNIKNRTAQGPAR